jgi:hypothetical protein
LLGVFLASGTESQAHITRIEIERVESPTFDGTTFGNVGQYEKLVGRAYGELDPVHDANKNVVLLDKAPRNAAGRVEYSVDVFILKPVDMRKGNRTLIYDVVNRGDLRAIQVFNHNGPGTNNPTSATHAGDGFLFKQGYTIVSSGWPADAVPGGNRLTGRFPIATQADGKPITKRLTISYTFTKPMPTIGIGYDGRNTRGYPAVLEGVPPAQLLRRPRPSAPPEEIPASEWSFAKCPEGRNPIPSDVDLCYPAGFSPNYQYDLVYTAKDPLVTGIGFVSTRDLVSFLRHQRSTGNPLFARAPEQISEGSVKHAIGFGRSQSGRYIKDLVYQGFNVDENKAIVFDGIMPLISGSRRMSVNSEFGMPSHGVAYTGGDQFPHTYATLKDPISGRTDGWLERCTRQKACPKVMHMDSSTEAWGARNSLVITDATGSKDVPIPDNVRLYYFTATQHNPASKPGFGICKHPANTNPRIDTIRALLVAMQAWITDGTTPPPTRFPRVSDGTLVPPLPPESFSFPKIPGVIYGAKFNPLYMRDFTVQPPRDIPEKRYNVLVPKVDGDGNEIGGIRSVALQVPLATYLGWNQRKAGYMEDEYCGLQGSTLPFAKTVAERGADPRPSLQERYGSKEAYVEKVRAAAMAMTKERLMLAEDAERVIQQAQQQDLGF